MQVVRDFNGVPAALRGGALTIGNFDGVHLGHRAVVERVREQANRLGAPAGAMLFDPHPRQFFQPTRPLFVLTPLPRRLELLAELKLDFAAVLAFDADMAGMTASRFVETVLVEGFGVRQVTVGHDFRFGKGRTGDGDFLAEAGRRHGFEVCLLPAVSDGAEVYSSSRVREALRQGRVDEAARQLGRPWALDGIVIAGAGRGAGFGYPTANMALPLGIELAHGIYAARAWIDGQAYKGAAYFGKRPALDNGDASFETFLLDFAGNIYGKHMRVELVDHVRPDRNFADEASLRAQMAQDVRDIERLLA